MVKGVLTPRDSNEWTQRNFNIAGRAACHSVKRLWSTVIQFYTTLPETRASMVSLTTYGNAIFRLPRGTIQAAPSGFRLVCFVHNCRPVSPKWHHFRALLHEAYSLYVSPASTDRNLVLHPCNLLLFVLTHSLALHVIAVSRTQTLPVFSVYTAKRLLSSKCLWLLEFVPLKYLALN